MISDLGRSTLKKCFHFSSYLVHTVHDPVIYHIGRDDLFPWKPGNTVNSNYFPGFFTLIRKTSHNNFQTLACTCTDLKVIPLAHFTADSFIHLPASNWDLTADNDLAPGNNRKTGSLGTNVYDHTALILLNINPHGNSVCNGAFYHINPVFTKPMPVCYLVIGSFFNGRHIQRNGKIHY